MRGRALGSRFRPTAIAGYDATLIVRSNDEERPALAVPLHGEGAMPILSVTPECLPAKRCTGAATVDPPAITFADAPFQGLLEPDPTTLPTVNLINEGDVELQILRVAIEGVLRREQPCTVRQVFYQLVSAGAVDKTEQEYKGTVCRLLAEMRREGRIPFRSIADNTRWQRKPDTWSSLEDALAETQNFYRRALWDDQDDYVEVWLEKDALEITTMD